MIGKKVTLGTKDSRYFSTRLFAMVLTLLLISLLASCAAPAETSKNNTSAAASNAPSITISAEAKPKEELVAALNDFGNESFIPWKATYGASYLNLLVYDTLIYWDEVNHSYFPGLVEKWEVSPDALTTTFYIRKGVLFQDGWGELNSTDLKFAFEKQAGRDSIGQTAPTRNISSMDIPDPYTLIVHLKKPSPTFFNLFSLGNASVGQGIISQKYYETVGEEAASQKPVGTGPYKLVDFKSGSYFKFEASDSHWRVVPEFKTLTVRLVQEVSTTVAMLKTREVDLAMIPAEQLADLQSFGLATETYGGNVLNVGWGGLAIPEDNRYDSAYHNKDPWTDMRVRKAMTIAVDRQAICDAIFAGTATPAGVPLFTAGMEKYQYPYDPAAAKKLLAEAGYPDGFSFRAISYTISGVPETPRVMEALVGYWQQIGLNPKITVTDYGSYGLNNRTPLRMAGDIFVMRTTPTADMLDRAAANLMPGAPAYIFMDEGSYTIWKEGQSKINTEEREAYLAKLLQYYYDNVGPGPLVVIGSNFSWNPEKISPFPHAASFSPYYLEYVCHAQPLNTFRLFSPIPGR